MFISEAPNDLVNIISILIYLTIVAFVVLMLVLLEINGKHNKEVFLTFS